MAGMAMWLRAACWFGASACLAHGRGRQLEDEATRCKDQPGFLDGEYIVGERAYTWHETQQNDTDGLHPSWNTSEDLLTITKDCPFKYEMHYGDTITLIFTKMEHYGTMGFDFTQEYQEGSDRLPGIRWFFAWEKYVDYYREKYGEISSEIWDAQYTQWRPTATGSYSWWADQYVDDVNEIRRDFYHQLNRTAGTIRHYSWRRRRNGRTYLWARHGNEQHWGAENGKLRVVLSAVESDQMTDKGQDTIFTGEMEFHEWGGTGDIKKEQYDAVKQFYMDTCANRRNGTAWNEPWEEPWSGWTWRRENDNNHDMVPYCTWIKEGWNESYWDAHIDHQGGTCHMMPGIRCDADANVIYISVSYQGMKGNVNSWTKFINLETVYCSFNQLSGTLPSFVSNSDRIRGFSIWHNFFEGSVPCLVGDSISFMDISYNNFDGTLPDCYGLNPRWRVLYLEHCYISGSFPRSWKTLKALGTLWLKYNELSGSLPPEICHLNSASSLNLEGNRIEGSIPESCLWSTKVNDDEVTGWANIWTVTGAHNRLSGGLPKINAIGKSYWALRYGTYDFDHNFFTGTITDQWEAILNVSRSVTFRFRDNRLSGPLPPQIEGWSKTYWQRVRYDFADNFFRCEPDGRWPDWVQRRVSDNLWGSIISSGLGKCLPVAHPTSVTPVQVTEGQAATLYVSGRDFVQRAFQTCRFTRKDTAEKTDAAALRVEDTLIRCQVPVTLRRGKYELTVSNFGANDFASKTILQDLGNLPVFDVVPVPVVEGANALEATITLGGVTPAEFAGQSENFVAAIAEQVNQEESTIRILDMNSNTAAGRRLQSVESVSPRFLVSINATLGPEHARDLINKLKDDAQVEQVMKKHQIPVQYVTVLQVGSTVVDEAKLTAGPASSSDDGGVPIIWIIIAAASGVIACCLCGFIFFLYYMERKGQAYFKESLDDVPDNEPSVVAAQPEKIGASQAEGAEV